MSKFLTILALVLAMIAAPSAAARDFRKFSFEGRVLRVKDGDSVILERLPMRRRTEIRLAGIDAPELGQPWGIQSRDALRRMLTGRTVRAEVHDRDRYNRLVAFLWLDRKMVNAQLVRDGHAWAFSRYLPNAEIRAAQIEARKRRRGLWALPEKDRIPPPTWRQQHPRRD